MISCACCDRVADALAGPRMRRTAHVAIPLPVWTSTRRSGSARRDLLHLLPARPLRDAKFGGAALSRLHDDLYIVPHRDQEAHEALDRITPELAGQHR